MKKSFKIAVVILLAAAIAAGAALPAQALSFAQSTRPFADVPAGSWYDEGSRYCFEHGYVEGTNAGEFSPAVKLTRAMAVQMIARMVGADFSAFEDSSSFTDVAAGAWYHDAVEWARAFGVTGGTGAGRFSPDAQVTRQDLAVMLMGLARTGGADVTGRADIAAFTDRADVSAYAEEAVSWAVSCGLIAGAYGRIMPRSGATRAQTAVIFMKYDGSFGHNWDGGAVIRRRTCTADGLTEYTCLDCGARTVVRTSGRHVYKTASGRTACINCGAQKPTVTGGVLCVLMYHEIRDIPASECNPWTTTPARFRADIEWLCSHGYKFYLPGEVASGAAIAEKAVMLIFDDGYSNVYNYAFPVLKEYGATAAVAIIGETLDERTPAFLTPEQCREMAADGTFEFGSHTYGLHPTGIGRLKGETRDEYRKRVWFDLDKNNALIEDLVGVESRFFTFPHGVTDKWADDYIRSNFDMSFGSVHGKANLARTGYYDLPRINVNAAVNLADVLR